MIRNTLKRLILRVPDVELESYVEIDDNRSPVTIVAFAGLAGMFGWTPAFEFRKILRKNGHNFNLLLFRDLHTLCYHVTPEGKPGGLEFYENKIKELLGSLGSRYHVAVGSSAGATAALYFGARCQMDSVVAFSPFLPCRAHQWSFFRACADLPLLARSPRAYSLAIGSFVLHRRISRIVGPDGLWPVLEEWHRQEALPHGVIYYGERNREDTQVAQRFAETGRIELIGLPTNSHAIALFLKKRGQLGTAITDRIQYKR